MIGMIASVLVIFTIAAASSVLLAWIPSQAVAAAVTEDVSLMAVPANNPNPSFVRPRAAPSEGKTRAAMTLNRKNNGDRLGNLFIISSDDRCSSCNGTSSADR